MGLLPALQAMDRWSLVAALAKTALLLVGARLVLFLYEGYRVRSRFRQLRAQGIPILEHSLLWGHLKVLGRIGALYPRDAHRHYIQIHIVQHWRDYFPAAPACPPVIYLDTWPVADAMAVVVDAAMCQELVQGKNAPKHRMIKDLVKYLCRGRSLTDWGGGLHRLWRSRLNPGFSAKNLQSHMATFVEEVGIYADRLKAAAGPNGDWGRVVQLLPLSVDLTFDIIGRVALGIRHEQTEGPTELQSALRTMMLRHVLFKDLKTLPKRLNPLWRYEGWKCQRSFRKILMPQILKQIGSEKATTAKTVIQLATKELNNEAGSIKGSASSKEYMRDVLGLMVQFLITWLFYYLAQAPEVREKLRAEHDEVFGPDPAAARPAVLANPALLNALPYTNAVVKEILRLVPIAATARQGSPDLWFVAPDGARYPSDGFVNITGTAMMHHHPDLWPRVNEFVPERWLAPEGDPMYPTPYAWRPFEYGPMNCIGRDVALIELRMTLLFTAREIDVECAWEEWDAMRGKTNETPTTLNGDRAYRTVVGLSSPKDDLPVHIRLRSPNLA